VIRIASSDGPDSIDPAFVATNVGASVEYATCLKLLNYPDRGGKAGSRLVPEAAQALPRVSRDGTTYTFTIRPGLRFSDGSRVSAVNFAAAMNRMYNRRMATPLALFVGVWDDIVGAKAMKSGKAKRLAGVIARGRTLVVKLNRPQGDLLNRLALVCPVPVDFPIDPAGVQNPPIPGSGPYAIASYTEGHQLVLKRNPYYRGKRPHQAAEIRMEIGDSQEENFQATQRGDVDYSTEGPPPARLSDVVARYGVGRSQFFAPIFPAFYYVVFNTESRLFRGNVALRRAVNFALDRPALARLEGPPAAIPTDQILPPSVPGFHDAKIYPVRGPDLRTARRLARGHLHGRRGVLYTANNPISLKRAEIVQRDLETIGIHVDVRSFGTDVLRARLSIRHEPFDLAIIAWRQDWPDPWEFLVPLLHGRSAPTFPKLSFGFNYGRFNVAGYNRRMNVAAQESGQTRYRSFAALEREILQKQAPLAPLYYLRTYIFVSKRVGCVTFNTAFGMDYAAMCVR
jgi:peptide/nickel transport system substrate-binding protein